MNQWWLFYWRIYASLGLNEFNEDPVLHPANTAVVTQVGIPFHITIDKYNSIFQVLPFLKIYLNQCPNLEHSAFSSYDYIHHYNCQLQQEFQVLPFMNIYLNQCPNLEHSAFSSYDYIHHYNCQLQQEFQVLPFMNIYLNQCPNLEISAFSI